MTQRRTWLFASTLATALMVLSACATTSSPRTVSETLAAHPQLTTLNRLVVENGLDTTLNGTGPFTVFAPTDEAFKALPAATLEALSKDKERVTSLLKFHVVPGTMTADKVQNGTAPTVHGGKVALSRAGTFVTIEDAVVTTPDVLATNGVVHLVDRVLTPPAAAK